MNNNNERGGTSGGGVPVANTNRGRNGNNNGNNNNNFSLPVTGRAGKAPLVNVPNSSVSTRPPGSTYIGLPGKPVTVNNITKNIAKISIKNAEKKEKQLLDKKIGDISRLRRDLEDKLIELNKLKNNYSSINNINKMINNAKKELIKKNLKKWKVPNNVQNKLFSSSNSITKKSYVKSLLKNILDVNQYNLFSEALTEKLVNLKNFSHGELLRKIKEYKKLIDEISQTHKNDYNYIKTLNNNTRSEILKGTLAKQKITTQIPEFINLTRKKAKSKLSNITVSRENIERGKKEAARMRRTPSSVSTNTVGSLSNINNRYSPQLANKLNSLYNSILKNNGTINNNKIKNLTKFFNDKNIYNILGLENNKKGKEFIRQIKIKFRNYNTMKDDKTIKTLFTKIYNLAKGQIKARDKTFNDRTYDFKKRSKAILLQGQIKKGLRAYKKNKRNTELKAKLHKWISEFNKIKNRLSGKTELKISDNQYKELIQYIYNDMVHDETIAGNNSGVNYFKSNIISIITKKRNNTNVNINDFNIQRISKADSDASAKTALSLSIRSKYRDNTGKIKVLKGAGNDVKRFQRESTQLDDLYVSLDADKHGLLNNLINKFTKFKNLKTPGSLLDPGVSMLNTNIIQKYHASNLREIQNSKLVLDTKPLDFIIYSDSYMTRFELKYEPKKLLTLYVNGQEIPLKKSRTEAFKGTSVDKISKNLGDLLQMLYVLKLKRNGVNAAFATFDMNASRIFIFLSEIFAEDLMKKEKKKANYNYMQNSNKKSYNKALRYNYLPKLIYMNITGATVGSLNNFFVHFINLKEYLNEATLERNINFNSFNNTPSSPSMNRPTSTASAVISPMQAQRRKRF